MKRIVVFGMGGIGGYIGARLGHGIKQMVDAGAFLGKPDLVFVARGAHLTAIKDTGLRYRSPEGTEWLVHPELATADPGNIGPADLIFLCVKGYDLASACQSIRPLLTERSIVVPLLNGADIHEQVRLIIKDGTVLPAGIYIASSLSEPGLVVHNGGKGNVFLGREPGKIDFDQKPLLLLLKHAGIPYDWFEDPLPAIWTKYLFIASFALVTARSGLGIGAVSADHGWATMVKEVQHEISAIARAKGIPLPADATAQAFEKGKAFGPDTKTSYQRDLEVPGKPNEGELFGGTILRLGKHLGVPTPTTERLFAEIQARSKR
jgi:2-dehydropantoate 2-reductase